MTKAEVKSVLKKIKSLRTMTRSLRAKEYQKLAKRLLGVPLVRLDSNGYHYKYPVNTIAFEEQKYMILQIHEFKIPCRMGVFFDRIKNGKYIICTED